MAEYISLSDILAVAKVHPFYSDKKFPPTREDLLQILAASKDNKNVMDLKSFPLKRKNALYQEIARLTVDTDPRNGYRRSTYISTTGGGSGGPPMVFATDSEENRRQRATIGSLMRNCGVIEPGDWVLTMHVSGNFYRALDLMTELFEQAGASVLCAGPEMSHQDVVDAISYYQVNIVTGDAGQLVQLAKYATTLTETQRNSIHLTKVLYTSEPMTPAQRRFVMSVFGDIDICSVIGSAEAGPWAISSSSLMGHTAENHADFIFDIRTILLEVLPLSIEGTSEDQIECLPDGEKGLLVQTSLERLRNPLVRYVCGDVASLHPLPQAVQTRLKEDAHHYRVVRIYGRDRQISFDWYGEYFEFQNVQALMRTETWGILQWQVILRNKTDDGLEVLLEIRLLRAMQNDAENISENDLVRKIRHFFNVFDFNEDLFHLKFLEDFDGFERSTTGRKVLNFVDLTGYSN
ncbi:hypothetical protein EYZ11_010862 [Aspergillus tanneri]|uniref:AMP-dependent synthetase/ligase domain-containing protein n=1 Tax=Aspergillus tanneri TaxID=1220188 RepID=A0A4S3J6F7_9EURO|nr:uncharacterized protein ATNIH1004_008205 [Aspergillus tanneri]KAA8644009.1 hypothetical protein ATNIH1004_008205 [Aspergillus tanneri]THC89687.1 hypothetical protein EYZ11_010862 [Aspergillus tanneri]